MICGKMTLGSVAMATAVLLLMSVNDNSNSARPKLRVAVPFATTNSSTGDLITLLSNLYTLLAAALGVMTMRYLYINPESGRKADTMSLALVLAIIVLVLRLELYRAMMAVLLINDESCFVLILLFYEADIVVFNIIYALLSFLPLACSLGMSTIGPICRLRASIPFNKGMKFSFSDTYLMSRQKREKREQRKTQLLAKPNDDDEQKNSLSRYNKFTSKRQRRNN